jgi:putative thioredoxin
VDVTDDTFPQVVEASTQYPVVALLWLPTDAANAELATTLSALANEYQGRFLLARVDAVTYPQIAAAFQVQGVPTVVAVVQGQPIPLFAGAPQADQIRPVLDEVLAAAQQAGVTGHAPGATVAEPLGPPILEPELPPLHQEAYDAIDRDDFLGAIDAYQRALKQDPSDADAQAGLAQVQLMQRSKDTDPKTARQAAADAPGDLAAAFAVADVDMMGGHVEDAFDRLLKVMADSDAEDKERVRKRLVEYFDVVGQTDPRVNKARQKLTMLLY